MFVLRVDDKNNIINHDWHSEPIIPGLNAPYPDSRYFRADKPLVSLKSPSVTYPKQDIRKLEIL